AWLKSAYGPGVTPGFNTDYMRALYRYGYEKARSDHLWTHEVPLAPGTAQPLMSKVTRR
ncbi:MAG: hypothetical protein HY765_07820, partial [Rhodomicrobium sp.]|nr:hypothetical protein [Rhodomicrobium sp.]